jgi:hypothetical protein
MGIDVEDVHELIADHAKELTTEELQELSEIDKQIEDVEHNVTDVATPQEIKAMFSAWEIVKATIKKHPDIETTELVTCSFEDKVLSHFKDIQRKRQIQSTLDTFVNKQLRIEEPEARDVLIEIE